MSSVTHFVLDDSASMRDIEQGVYDGVQEMLARLPRDDLVTISRFNERVSLGGRVVCGDVEGVEKGKCIGRTALLDAILEALSAEMRDPVQATHIVVVTDGMDNASRTSAEEVSRKVEQARRERGWTVSFLGCNQDAVVTARTLLGVQEGHALTYQPSAEGAKTALRALSDNTDDTPCRRIGTFTSLQRQASLPASFPAPADVPVLMTPPAVGRQMSKRDMC